MTSQAPERVLGFQYVTYTDVFRIVPYRWLGYGFTMQKMLNMHRYYCCWGNPDVGQEEEFGLLSKTTLLYVVGHALFLSTVASADVWSSHMSHCTLAARSAYVWMSALESLAWDLMTSVALPYLQGFFIYHVLDGMLLGTLGHSNPLRLFLPGSVAAFSIPYTGPYLDHGMDKLLAYYSKRFTICPKPVFYRVWIASNASSSVKA